MLYRFLFCGNIFPLFSSCENAASHIFFAICIKAALAPVSGRPNMFSINGVRAGQPVIISMVLENARKQKMHFLKFLPSVNPKENPNRSNPALHWEIPDGTAGPFPLRGSFSRYIPQLTGQRGKRSAGFPVSHIPAPAKTAEKPK